MYLPVPTNFPFEKNSCTVSKYVIHGFYDDFQVFISSSQGKNCQIPSLIAGVSGHFHHLLLAKPSSEKGCTNSPVILESGTHWNKQNMWWRRTTLQETNISHLGKRKIIFKTALVGDMLVARMLIPNIKYWPWNTNKYANNWNTANMTISFSTFSQAHVHSMYGVFINLLISHQIHHPCR